jgi:serine phosphatase RsbU (regulator of sigma subunit)
LPSRLAVVRAVASALGSSRTEDEVAEAVLDAVCTHLDAVTTSLWLMTPDGAGLRLTHERNGDPRAVATFARIPIEAELPGPQVVRSGEPCFVGSRADRDARWPVLAGTPSRSEAFVVLPLSAMDETLGVVSFGFAQPREFDADDRIAMLAVADQCAIALDRARLYQAARADADANHLLARVSAAGGGHDWLPVARQIAASCTDRFVDSCVVYIREGGVVRRAAASSRSFPGAPAELVDRFPTPLSSESPNAVAIRSGEDVHLPPIDEAQLAAITQPEFKKRVEHIRFGDAWMIPLLDAGRAFGAMLFATAVGHDMSAADVVLARQVAERTAVILRSATEYGQHRAALEALHDVLLPAAMPEVPGYDVSACYVPFTAGPNVGGDWWDVLRLRNGCVALSVGDVAGHGIPAVAVMGQLRNAMRARLVAGVDPAAVLDELSALLDWTDPDAHATAVIVVLQPETGALTWASAGHPPPLVALADGSSAYLDDPPGPPLGVTTGRRREHVNRTAALPAGALLHLFTDGLVEGRERPIDVGLKALAAAADREPARPLQLHCEQLVAALVERPEDDVCLLIAQRHDVADHPSA